MNLKFKELLITGATGSFGNAILDHLKGSGAHFIVYSRDECKQHDMYFMRKDEDIQYIVGDIRDKNKLIDSMKGVDYVIHAAALKHIPTGELFPEEVIQTNILGTKNVIDAAEECGVKRLVYLSTDKACYPISGYGMSKAMGEKIVMAHHGNTINVCLRYGNVLGSRGSVIPLFLGQINRNQPLTITNQNMTRFVITLEQACKLSIKCLKDGNSGDLFIMKPPSCTVGTIAEALELYYNREFAKSYIGIRLGEKMHEVLLTGDEMHRSKEEKEDDITYARISPKNTTDFYSKGENYIEPPDYSSGSAIQLNAQQVLEKLKEAKLL